MAEPLLAIPEGRQLRSTLVLAAGFLAVFYPVYGATSWITSQHRFRLRADLDFEAALPFLPAAAVVYLSLNLMFLLVPFILRTWRDAVPLLAALLGETAVAAVCFLLLPVSSGYPQPAADGAFAGVFRVADALNLDHNYLPSLHVAFAFTAAVALGRRGGWRLRTFFLLWAVAIAASTVLTHQHHLADVAAGVVLAVVAMRTVHRRASRPAFLDALRIEWICLRELARLARRHLRYAVLGMVLYRYSLPRWRRSRILRAAYCFAQHVDDVLDGDHDVDRDPDAYAGDLCRQIRDQRFDTRTAIGFLARFVAAELDLLRAGADHPKDDLLALIETLRFDRRRLDGRLLLPAVELAEHHRKTFYYSLNVTLILVGSRLRADAVPELIDALCWCSPLRDLEEDLGKGLVNVPREAVEAAGHLTGVPSYDELVATRAVRDWMAAEYRRGRASIAASERRLSRLAEGPGKRTLGLLTTALGRYAGRYERRHRELLSPLPVPRFSPAARGVGDP